MSKAYREFEGIHKGGTTRPTPFDGLKHYYDVEDFPELGGKKHRKFTNKFRTKDMELLKDFFDERSGFGGTRFGVKFKQDKRGHNRRGDQY